MQPVIPIESFSVFATEVDHPECVAFDREGHLWAGGESGQIYRITAEGVVRLVATLGGFCAGLAFSTEGDLFVCNSPHGVVRVKTDGAFSVFASHAGEHKIICANYGLFDVRGNYYLTDSGHWKKRNGFLLRFRPDGRGEILAGPFGYPNGLALSADGSSLFMVESETNSVLRIEIRADQSIGAATTYAADCGRFPDGLTLDADGNLYVCCYASDEIWRIGPSGEKDLLAWDPWAILLGSPTNMAFGGKDFDELYVANLARTTITRARVGCRGQLLPWMAQPKPNKETVNRKND
ncbi:MAG TPA: SMP-30/gluconolactonase/LRE family protein [Candidatus Saccharimonadales bacterium]|nr:SMP-30/gluconolactonase/LRE family protein [Candidatus Saccharimonadales bacterium]